MLFDRTIAAISTPPGKGGVAVIRISGKEALSVAAKIFLPKGKRTVEAIVPRMQIYGSILHMGEEIDDGLITYFPAPNSYTGEDVIEISCHGGVLITSKVLESAYIAGAFPAERGEFTKRAFVNGKLSLTEAESVAMLLEAGSEAQIKLSRSSSRSKLKAAIQGIRERLVSLLSSAFARIDYPDEDLGDFSDSEMLKMIDALREEVKYLAQTYKTGRAVSDGVSTVICGKPNVGKSTLYNLLVGENAAIVTDIPGTTRDVLEKKVPLGDVMLKLYDTAGIRGEGADAVENIGISRSREKIDTADLVFALFDSTRALDAEDKEIIDYLKDKSCERIALITKCDDITSSKHLEELLNEGFANIIEISSETKAKETLDVITRKVMELFTDEKIKIGEDAVISSARQNAALVKALSFLDTAAEALRMGLPQDAVSSDVELALGAIGELDGKEVTEEVVSDIFANFCVGK
ncbi:MAG: tRNA uridine-5-carboxymethylaminomethyl(34) synthesis GTPase MnmE [Ruminococcaceae bacterium]|nr:tRNA uridine-5-carboxymethylaminomethyl(34) synthesis GTPase MnmE [Oscillospiraceae bacterium]